ncbi:hypothetical protein MNB_SV-12-861 [hydrothermal vent metagenome]|uniref:Lipoprotein n=1 Tax=hydrothermal vent metagenome TaxID=652676 RepID=A0A1W1CJW9_9ZZZZ
MTKKILLATMVVAFTFSGCSLLSDSQPATDKAAKTVKKVGDTADKAKDATAKAEKAIDAVKGAEAKVDASAESALPQSSMKDQVVEEVVEVADKKTDGAATKIIESVK